MCTFNVSSSQRHIVKYFWKLLFIISEYLPYSRNMSKGLAMCERAETYLSFFLSSI